MKRLLVEYRFIAVGVGLAILHWITESYLDLFDSAHEGATYIERLFASGDPNELLTRLITIILLIAFGVYAQTLIRDVKRAEEKFQVTEQKYRTLVERMPAVVYIQEIGSPDSAMYMSPQIETLTGYSPEDCKDPDLRWQMVHPDDRQRLQSEDEQTGRPGEVFTTEYRVLHRDGRTVWVRNESVVIEDETSGSRYWQGFMLDITERKEAGEALRKSEERYRLVARATDETIWDSDILADEQVWNGAVETMFGYPQEQRTDTAWWEEQIHPEDRARVVESVDAVFESGGEMWSGEYRFRRADGAYLTVEDR